MSKFVSIDHDYAIMFCKDKSRASRFYISYDDNYLKRYKEEDEKGKFFWDTFARNRQGSSNIYEIEMPNGTLKKGAWIYKKDKYELLKNEGEIRIKEVNNEYTIQIKQRLNIEGQIARSLILDSENQQGTQEVLQMLGREQFSYPKPEALLKRIIEISTKEGDLIMDFFAGSGTTLAVAHKMKRRWIGIEQMDYVKSITKKRLKKVVEGEQGGVSKALNWQGGGSFIYLELMPLNAVYKEKISNLQVLKNRQDKAQANACHSENFASHSNDTHHSNTPCHSSSPSCHSSTSPCHSERSEESINKNFDDLDSSASPQNDKDCKQNKTLDSTSTQEVRLDSTSTQEITLESIYKDLQEKAFIDYRVDIQAMLKDKEFEALSIEDKKKLLYSILDSNMDYVLYDDIEDSEYKIDKDLIALNKAFYGANDE